MQTTERNFLHCLLGTPKRASTHTSLFKFRVYPKKTLGDPSVGRMPEAGTRVVTYCHSLLHLGTEQTLGSDLERLNNVGHAGVCACRISFCPHRR